MDHKLQQRLYILVILLGLLPTILVFGWGVYKAVQAPETHLPTWIRL